MRADIRLVWLAMLCAVVTQWKPGVAAPVPRGFAVLGSSIPEDAKHWVDVYKVIQTNNLQKYEPEVLKNR
ncbi:MAG: hypothetical protein HY318_06135, partial [Armatimonadetes bacterium]|nr:hypothetical protein [Armatimonadota bacterium]